SLSPASSSASFIIFASRARPHIGSSPVGEAASATPTMAAAARIDAVADTCPPDRAACAGQWSEHKLLEPLEDLILVLAPPSVVSDNLHLCVVRVARQALGPLLVHKVDRFAICRTLQVRPPQSGLDLRLHGVLDELERSLLVLCALGHDPER